MIAKTIAIKVLLLVPVLFLVSLGTFFMVSLVPGDPAVSVLGPNASRADYIRVDHQLGLDRPVLQRYFEWLGHAVHGDLGENLIPPVDSVSTRVKEALPVNLELAALAIIMGLVVAIPTAMWSAYRVGGRFDRLLTAGSLLAISIPTFLLAIVLLLILAVKWQVFPLGQWERPTSNGWLSNLYYAFLPTLALAIPEGAVFARLLRSDMISVLKEDYILAARARGMATWHILLKEALRPSSFSLVTLGGLSIGRLIGGTIIVEQVFALPGLGRVIVGAAMNNDYPLVQGGVLVIAVIYVAVNLIVDILYQFIDPRIRRGAA